MSHITFECRLFPLIKVKEIINVKRKINERHLLAICMAHIVPQFRGEGRKGTGTNQQSDERQCDVGTRRQVINEMTFE